MKAIILFFCLCLTSAAFASNLPAEECTKESAHIEKSKQTDASKETERKPANDKKQSRLDYDPIGRIR